MTNRRSRQIGLRTILFFIVPLAAGAAWVVSLDGPYVDPQRVVTHKVGLLVALANGAFVFALLRQWWANEQGNPLRPIALTMLSAWLIFSILLAIMVLRNREQGLERERLLKNSPSPVARILLETRR
jgi:hypothetical protein